MCGVGGVVEGKPNSGNPFSAALLLRDVLRANSHRAEDCVGALAYDPETDQYVWHKDMGSVDAVLTNQAVRTLSGSVASGHLRWSTFGDTNSFNIHPIFGMYKNTLFGVSHNGEVGTDELERWFPNYEPHTTTDTKLFAALISHSQQSTFEEAIQEACFYIKGTYSLLIQHKNDLYAVRDITGNKPLFYGRNGSAYIVSSESPAVEILGKTEPKEVEAGTMVKITQQPFGHEVIPIRKFPEEMPRHLQVCLFESFYYMRPDTYYLGRRVFAIRERLGEFLGRRMPKADVIMPVPDSGIHAGRGCSRASGIPLGNGIIRSRQVGRYFIKSQSERLRALKEKYNFIPEEFRNKRVSVIDDSLIEGTTARYIIERARALGAREVHVGISSPPIIARCSYGTQIDKMYRDLLASHYSPSERVEKVGAAIGADTLCYLTLDEMVQGIMSVQPTLPGYSYGLLGFDDFCMSCFTGMYKIPGNIPEKVVHE